MRQWLKLTVAACVAAVVLLIGGNAQGAEPNDALKARLREIAARFAGLNTERMLMVASDFAQAAQDAGLTDEERAWTIHAGMEYCVQAEMRSQIRGGLDRAEEFFQIYDKTFRGRHRDVDFAVLKMHSDMQQTYLARGRKDKLQAALDAADALSRVYPADDANHQMGLAVGALARATAHLRAGDTGKAAEMLEEYVKRYPGLNAAEALIALAETYTRTDRRQKAMDLLCRGIENNRTDFPTVKVLSDRFLGCAQADKSSDEELWALMLARPVIAQRIQPLTVALLCRKLDAKEYDASLSCAKFLFDTSMVEDADPAIGLVVRTARPALGDFERINTFIKRQEFGAIGPDRQAGTADDLSDVLKDIPSVLTPEIKGTLEQRLVELVPQQGRIYECLLERGTVCQMLGRCPDALTAFRSAFAAASPAQTAEASGLVPRVLKQVDGDWCRGVRHLQYVQYGPAGSDGKVGTGDDLADVLAQEKLTALSPEVEQALRKMADGPAVTFEDCVNRGLARLALGEYAQGLAQMEKACTFVGEDRATAIGAVAAAVKAADGNVAKANRYLQYEKYGPAGPDGKANTADDLPDPLPEVKRPWAGSAVMTKSIPQIETMAVAVPSRFLAPPPQEDALAKSAGGWTKNPSVMVRAIYEATWESYTNALRSKRGVDDAFIGFARSWIEEGGQSQRIQSVCADVIKSGKIGEEGTAGKGVTMGAAGASVSDLHKALRELMVKYPAYGWSKNLVLPPVRDLAQTDGAQEAARFAAGLVEAMPRGESRALLLCFVADEAARAHDSDAAVKSYQAALEESRKLFLTTGEFVTAPAIAYSRALLERQDWDRLKELEAACGDPAMTSDAQLALAEVWYRGKAPPDLTSSLYRRYMEKAPSRGISDAATFRLFDSYIEANDIAGQQALIDRLTRASSGEPYLYRYLAQIHLRKERLDESLKCVIEYVKRFPSDKSGAVGRLHRDLGRALMSKGRTDEGVRELLAAVETGAVGQDAGDLSYTIGQAVPQLKNLDADFVQRLKKQGIEVPVGSAAKAEGVPVGAK